MTKKRMCLQALQQASFVQNKVHKAGCSMHRHVGEPVSTTPLQTRTDVYAMMACMKTAKQQVRGTPHTKYRRHHQALQQADALLSKAHGAKHMVRRHVDEPEDPAPLQVRTDVYALMACMKTAKERVEGASHSKYRKGSTIRHCRKRIYSLAKHVGRRTWRADMWMNLRTQHLS